MTDTPAGHIEARASSEIVEERVNGLLMTGVVLTRHVSSDVFQI